MAAAAQILLDEATHTYTRDDVKVPGVTEVLEDTGIIDYNRIPDGTRVMALERGRFVHQICHYWDEGDLGEFDPKLAGYLEAWKHACDDLRLEFDLIEWRGYCAHAGYAGTLDRRFKFIREGGVGIGDIKTGIAPWWTAVQTALYANFFPSPAQYRRLAFELHADATYRVLEFRCADFSRDLNIGLAALTVFNAKRSHA